MYVYSCTTNESVFIIRRGGIEENLGGEQGLLMTDVPNTYQRFDDLDEIIVRVRKE